MMALLIVYCGVAIPLEIGFEDDLRLSMCGSPSTGGLPAQRTSRRSCPAHDVWFWANLLVDMIFVLDIILNMRTGYIVEGHVVHDDWCAPGIHARNLHARATCMRCTRSIDRCGWSCRGAGSH
jgi:hypothetical protein